MTFQRHQRRIVGCAIATAIALAAPAYAKPEDKAKPAASVTAAKPDEKGKTAKPAAKNDEKATKAKKKNAPIKTAAAKKPVIPLPRARPILVASTIPMALAKAT